jgi:hypothetical protein
MRSLRAPHRTMSDVGLIGGRFVKVTVHVVMFL